MQKQKLFQIYAFAGTRKSENKEALPAHVRATAIARGQSCTLEELVGAMG